MREVQLRPARQGDTRQAAGPVTEVVSEQLGRFGPHIGGDAVTRALEQVDEALVALAEGLADAVDADPGNAALWWEYRAVVLELRRAGLGGVDDDGLAFLALVRTPRLPAALGDGTD